MEPTDDLPPLAALAEPVRRALYELVSSSREPVSREQAATGLDVPVHTAKFHLDRLVDEGLLEVEFRRLTGRTGPGAGRPAKLYRRSGREFAVSVPPRSYDLVGSVLAEAVELAAAERRPPDIVAGEVARRRGVEHGRTAPGAGDSWAVLTGALEPLGYQPVQREECMTLENCPFDRVAREHTRLVCGLNADYVSGVVEGLGCADLDARLEPGVGRCCVTVRRRG